MRKHSVATNKSFIRHENRSKSVDQQLSSCPVSFISSHLPVYMICSTVVTLWSLIQEAEFLVLFSGNRPKSMRARTSSIKITWCGLSSKMFWRVLKFPNNIELLTNQTLCSKLFEINRFLPVILKLFANYWNEFTFIFTFVRNG